MDLPYTFFEDEVRDGFYVPALVKRAWGAELKVLEEIDRICRKYDIKYFADWGTLLGAVRHNGFIPWDDDLDISMLRKDYKRFLEVAPKEFTCRFKVYTYRENESYRGFVGRVVANERICFEKDYLDNFCQFPYIAGVDVFVWDYVSRDKKREEDRCKKARTLIEAADLICDTYKAGTKSKMLLKRVEEICEISIPATMYPNNQSTTGELNALRIYMYEKAEELFGLFDENESDVVTRMMPNGLYYGNLEIPIQYFKDSIRMPFENITVPVQRDYDSMLELRYGNYMSIIKSYGGHDYPFFKSQEKSLRKLLLKDGITFLNEKKYSDYLMEHDKNSGNSLKRTAEECMDALRTFLDRTGNAKEETLQMLADSQQLAIDFGSLIEKCRGEGTATVGRLQDYCEKIFEAWTGISDGGLSEAETALQKLKTAFDELENIVSEEILKREIVVFLPYQISKWESMKVYYNREIEKGSEVYILPIPYYYKRFDGSCIETVCESEIFSQLVPVTPYDKFDFELNYPDRIYIQSVWDNENPVLSVHRFFYAENLRKYTDNLIYICPFYPDDFSESNEREYSNLQEYCTMPGVIYSDSVIVHSEAAKNVYVSRLTEFAGKETQNVWERKIIIEPDGNNTDINSAGLPDRLMEFYNSARSGNKKILLYFIGIPAWIKYDENIILEKLKRTSESFSSNKDNLEVVLCMQKGTEMCLEDCNGRYNKAVEFIKAGNWLYVGEDFDSRIEKICDAYYGDTSNIVQSFRNGRKPVMIQDYML